MSVSCMRRGLLLAPLLITSGLVCGAASAVPLTFEYSGTCVYNCEDEGLEVGAPAYMKLVMDDAGYTPDGYFGIEALIDFSFDLGGIEIELGDGAQRLFRRLVGGHPRRPPRLGAQCDNFRWTRGLRSDRNRRG